MNYPQIKPTLNLDFSNTKTLDPRINFRRGTPGAYYDGKTYAKAEENLLSYSEDFNDTENYWSEVRATLTGSQVSPIDSTSAYELSQTSTDVAGVLLVTVGKIKLQIGKQYVSSVYVKASSSNYFAIAEEVSRNNPTGTAAFTYFNLSNSGEVMLSHENHIASIQNVGNQWYRCSIMFTAKIEEDYTVMFYLDSGSSQSIVKEPQNVEAGSSVYLWGAQLEQRDSVTSYTKTDGTPKTKYQPQLMFASPDQPRFDYDVLTGESKGLLIEESRTNLIAYSQQIEKQSSSSDNYNVWVVSNTSNVLVDLSASIAPDGTLSASKFYADDFDYTPSIHQQTYTTDTTPETLSFSVFAKAGQANRYLQLFAGSGDVDGNPFVNFNLFDGTISRDDDSIGSIEDVGNGWYRCIITFVTTSTGDIPINPVIYLIDNANATRAPSMTGDGYSGIFIWGAQLEVGSFPTSYIKTSGAPSGTERSADNASITGENFSSWYRQDEGSILFDLKLNEDSGWKYIFGITTNGNWQQDLISSRHLGSNLQAILKKQSVDFNSSQIGFSQDGNFFNLGFVYKNDSAVINTSIGSDEYAPKIASGLNRIDLFSINGSDYKSCGHIKKLSYYPQRLTNEQLQQLTK